MVFSEVSLSFAKKHPDAAEFMSSHGMDIAAEGETSSECIAIDGNTGYILGWFADFEALSAFILQHQTQIDDVYKDLTTTTVIKQMKQLQSIFGLASK